MKLSLSAVLAATMLFAVGCNQLTEPQKEAVAFEEKCKKEPNLKECLDAKALKGGGQ
jgi:hypothetical protein